MADLTGKQTRCTEVSTAELPLLKALKGAILTLRNRRKLANVGLRLFATRGHKIFQSHELCWRGAI